MKRITLAQAKKEVPEGISLRRKDGEYRVTFDGAEVIKRFGLGANAETYAYYTDDLHDALETAHAMVKARKVSTAAHVTHERSETASYERSEHAKPKRGPGRPRKVATEPEPVKRGPGRPRKVATETTPVATKRTETPEQVKERMARVRAARGKSGK